MTVLQKLAAAVAVVFGLVTLVAGGRVLLGGDPGYAVFRPLLVYNTVMGLAYVGGGVALWRDAGRGRRWAGAVALLNLIVLVAILLVRRSGGGVAAESVGAMALRTGVWVVLFLAAWWILRSGERGSPD